MASFKSAIVTVATGGTPVALGTGTFNWLYIMAHQDNTGQCHVGASTVVSAVDGTAVGILVPDQTDFAASAIGFIPLKIDGIGNFAEIFVDAVTNGDSVTYFAQIE